MEKKMENEMETGIIGVKELKLSYSIGLRPKLA